MEVSRYEKDDLDGIVKICLGEGWPSIPENPDRAHRVLTAPGVTTVVAREGKSVLGFAYIQSDGEIQAHLSLIAVDPSSRRQGIGRQLLELALHLGGGSRVDLVTEEAPEFYEALHHRELMGYRIYPPFR
jgi:ribosomal protein S18 acetylase RimI-like enzyme